MTSNESEFSMLKRKRPLTVPNLIPDREAKKTVNTILNGEGDPCFGGPKTSRCY